MSKVLELLKERLLFGQCSDEKVFSSLLESEKLSFYVGIDPTFKSLHIGHVMPLIALKYLCEAGHKGFILLGGGTARIGDPSGKTQTRKMLSYEDIDANVESIKKQIKGFLNIDEQHLMFVNNKEWLSNLNYIDFLRDIGSHFSVNKMLSFESYKRRMETGLSFIEFNYQLLQSYDFLQLNSRYGVKVQLGGDDQWGNMVAGSDLIRRKGGSDVLAFTIPLLLNSEGQKMGKTEGGALFLDSDLVSPYQFFQYWRNITDTDVRSSLLIFTQLSVEKIDEMISSDINNAKECLAYEITKFIHKKENADKALEASKAAFGKDVQRDAMPTISLEKDKLSSEINIVDLFVFSSLAKTKSDARRLIEQGGAFLEGEVVKDIKMNVTLNTLLEDGIVLRAGKKRIIRVIAF
ncbi:MAG: tyrosine--tRNA ligase [Treponema sp.]